MAGNNRGAWFIPDVDDEVLVAFEAGDARRPYVIGAIWNGKDAPPESMDDSGNNDRKVLRSRNGVKVTLDDQDGKEQLILETPGGQKHHAEGRCRARSRSKTPTATRSSSNRPASPSTRRPRSRCRASQVCVSASLVQVDAGMSKFSAASCRPTR